MKDRDFRGREAWCSADDVPLEALRHFTDERLSVFELESHDEVLRAVAAFALAHPQRLENNDFLVVDRDRITIHDFVMEKTDAGVPDPVIAARHRECVGLKPDQKRRLAFEFAKHGIARRITLGILKALVRMAHDNDFYDASRLSSGVAKDVAKVLAGGSAETCVDCAHRTQEHMRSAEDMTCLVCSVSLTGRCVVVSR